MKLNFKPHFLHNADPENTGGGAGSQEKSAENKLIENIRTAVAEQVRSMTGDDDFKKSLSSTFENYLGNLNPDQLRSLADDNNKVKLDLATISTQLEKIEQRAANSGVRSNSSINFVEALIEKRFNEIEKVINQKNASVDFNFNLRAAEIITTENIVDFDGLDVDDIKDTLSITDFVPKRRARQYIFDIADRTTVQAIEKNKTWYTEGDEEGAFAIVAESGFKPLVSIDLIPQVSKVKKVAGHSVYTDEVPKFKQQAYQIIRRLINDKLLRDYQNQLTTELVAAAGPYVSSALDGQYANPTDFHAMAAVAAQIESLDFYPDTLVIHPQDKWRIGMSQDQTGAFYMAVPASSPDAQPKLLGFNVITSTKITVGNFILGEAGLWKIEDEGVTVKIGYGTTTRMNEAGTAVVAVEDDITHNRFRVISEMYYHSYIDQAHAGSFILGNFEVIKELLTAEEVPAG